MWVFAKAAFAKASAIETNTWYLHWLHLFVISLGCSLKVVLVTPGLFGKLDESVTKDSSSRGKSRLQHCCR